MAWPLKPIPKVSLTIINVYKIKIVVAKLDFFSILSGQFETLYTGRPSRQVDPLYRWALQAGESSIQVGPLYRWVLHAGGSSIQVVHWAGFTVPINTT